MIDPSIQGVNELFVLSFENEAVRTEHTGYYFPKEGIKDCNDKIDRWNPLSQLLKNDIKTYKSIQKIATGQGDNYTTGFLLDYSYFKENYKIIVINLSKQQS